MSFQSIANYQWAEFLDQLRQTHSRTESQIQDKKPSKSFTPITSKPIEYTDEDREQFEHDRFIFLNDERQTAF